MIMVPTIAKGTATMRRIDQYMPRHIEDEPGLSAVLDSASLQSGQADSERRAEDRRHGGDQHGCHAIGRFSSRFHLNLAEGRVSAEGRISEG